MNKVLKKYPHLGYKKVYHAGESKDHVNKNLEVAIQSGSVRIEDGINALQRILFLAHKESIFSNKTQRLIWYWDTQEIPEAGQHLFCWDWDFQ